MTIFKDKLLTRIYSDEAGEYAVFQPYKPDVLFMEHRQTE